MAVGATLIVISNMRNGSTMKIYKRENGTCFIDRKESDMSEKQIVKFEDEEYECMKEFILPKTIDKKYLWDLCTEGYLKRMTEA